MDILAGLKEHEGLAVALLGLVAAVIYLIIAIIRRKSVVVHKIEVDNKPRRTPASSRVPPQSAMPGVGVVVAAVLGGVIVAGVVLVVLSRRDKPISPATPGSESSPPAQPTPKLDPTSAQPAPELDPTPVNIAPLPHPRPDPLTKLKPGEEVDFPLAGELKMTFCWIPPGTAQLGSPKAEQDAVAEQIGRRDQWLVAESEAKRGVYTSKGFWLAKYPVTQAEWYAITGESPSHFQVGGGGADTVKGLDTDRFPVENVSRDMICGKGGFMEKMNAVGRTEQVFGTPGRFALPHEDAWEYACRGGLGNKQPFYWGKPLNGTQANINGNYPFGTAVKGSYPERPTAVGTHATQFPHPWGLCDIHGNVWEWCENLYEHTSMYVRRGGSWSSPARDSRAAYRNWNHPNYRYNDVGLRVCFAPN